MTLDLGSVPRLLLGRSSASAAARPAVALENDVTWTRRELYEMTNRFSHALLGMGVKRGDRVGLLLRNMPEYLALVFAVAQIGAVAVRLNWRLSNEEMVYILIDSDPSAICVDMATMERFQPALTQVHISRRLLLPSEPGTTNSPGSTVWGESADPPDIARPEPADACTVLYTSGTTGRPKGAVWSHANCLWFAAMQVMKWKYDENATHLAVGPMYHVSALEDHCLPVLLAGGQVVYMRSGGFELGRAMKVIRDQRCTDAMLFPFMIERFLELAARDDQALATLQRVTTGGSPLPTAVVTRWRRELGPIRLEQMYGLTEGGGIATVMDYETISEHPGSSGRPLPLTEVRIVDVDTGRELRSGDDGEIWVRSPAVSGQYHRNPRASAATFVGDWCRTGDLGRVTEDGYLYVSGRFKEMIKSGGENVYPVEVESVLSEHPAVADVAVVPVPDRQFQEVVGAVVVLEQSRRVTAADLVSYCRSRLAAYKAPRHVVFLPHLPRNESGKVLKEDLLEDVTWES